MISSKSIGSSTEIIPCQNLNKLEIHQIHYHLILNSQDPHEKARSRGSQGVKLYKQF
jgi:hypothetical protein